MTSEKAPERIWLQHDPEGVGEGFPDKEFWEYVTWAAGGKVYETDVGYIHADVADAMVAAQAEVLIKAAGTFCWNRYAMNKEYPAVFTSHTHQRIEEALRQAIPSDARAALSARDRQKFNDGIEHVAKQYDLQARYYSKACNDDMRAEYEGMAKRTRALKKGPEA